VNQPAATNAPLFEVSTILVGGAVGSSGSHPAAFAYPVT
jgi:hypothetical protein